MGMICLGGDEGSQTPKVRALHVTFETITRVKRIFWGVLGSVPMIRIPCTTEKLSIPQYDFHDLI